MTVAALAVSSDNRNAVLTSGLLTNDGSWCQGVRISSPAIGRIRNRTPIAAGTNSA